MLPFGGTCVSIRRTGQCSIGAIAINQAGVGAHVWFTSISKCLCPLSVTGRDIIAIEMNPSAAIPWSADPRMLVERWPRGRQLVSLWSGREHARWARWSIFAEPAGWLIGEALGAHSAGALPVDVPAEPKASPLETLAHALELSEPVACCDSKLPFKGGWIGTLSYELGPLFEPAATRRRPTDMSHGNWPLYALAWCPRALVFDHVQQSWYSIGDTELLRDAIDRQTNGDSAACHWSARFPTVTRDDYEQLVIRTKELIAAGDIFQANITRMLRGTFDGSVRRLSSCAQHVSEAWYGAHLELPDGRAIVSMSPELFAEVNGSTRGIVTRPIKGTRRQCTQANGNQDSEALLQSTKDTAELNMIIDLMRNDLSRVCDIGSVIVPHGRIVESHPTILHGVGEVRGQLRSDARLYDLLAATFPAGSITGAPKIRAMQIIEHLESEPRGAYCGSIGFASVCGNACFNVAIRTVTLDGQRANGRYDRLEDAVTSYGTGAGIVADSDPAREFAETEDKAAVLRRLQNASTTVSPPLVSVAAAAARQCTGRSDQPRMADGLD